MIVNLKSQALWTVVFVCFVVAVGWYLTFYKPGKQRELARQAKEAAEAAEKEGSLRAVQSAQDCLALALGKGLMRLLLSTANADMMVYTQTKESTNPLGFVRESRTERARCIALVGAPLVEMVLNGNFQVTKAELAGNSQPPAGWADLPGKGRFVAAYESNASLGKSLVWHEFKVIGISIFLSEPVEITCFVGVPADEKERGPLMQRVGVYSTPPAKPFTGTGTGSPR
jgi:hypothetical protein